MPLCGVKKSKKQKREPSPPYSSERNQEFTARVDRLNEQITTLDNEVKHYKQKYLNEAEKRKTIAEENSTLKTQLQELKSSSDVSDGSKDLVSKLETAEGKVAEAEALKKDLEAANTKLSEELENTKKEINEVKKKTEGDVNKIQEDLKLTKSVLEKEETLRKKAEDEREKYKREKDSIDNKLAHTSKELDIARKESLIPRSPTRAPSDEWVAKIKTAEAELEKERNQRLEKEKENSRLNNEKNIMEREKSELAEKVDVLSRRKDELENLSTDLQMNYKNEMKRLEDKVRDTEEDKEKLLVRLSRETAAKVLDNNPNVADISDPNRPQKLGEQLAQVYDDQWTDATEALEATGINEDESVKILLDLITTIYTHCKEAAENQMSRIDEDLFLPPLENDAASSLDTNGVEQLKSPTSSKSSMSKIPRFTSHKGRPALPNITTERKTVDNDSPGTKDKDKNKRFNSSTKIKGDKRPEVPTEIRKGIKDYRKRVMKLVWPVIEKEIIGKLRANENFPDKTVDVTMPYITKCVELCWYMRVQDPPVVLSWSTPIDKTFDTDMYRGYLKNGTHVEYVVWPAMYLCEGGPTLSKGVAQGCDL
ncbi:hypothetical protein ACF0H5_010648 [Mactra antiquata]